jgi:hypothetical protein
MSPSTTSPEDVYMPGLPAQKANQPVEVTPSADEIARGCLNDANIKLFLSGMHRDGIVVLKDVIDPSHLDAINQFMVDDTVTELRKEGLHTNFGVENLQQGPPLTPELFYDDVYLNGILHHAVNLYLGPHAKWNLCSGNNALPRATERQPPHSDAMMAHPPCPFYAVANIFTVDTSAANGATEIWLGTHHYDRSVQTAPTAPDGKERGGSTHIRPEIVAARSPKGFQPTVRRGSIVFRDLRLWHAGMPNRSEDTRYMIAMGFAAGWWHGTARFRVPTGTGMLQRILHGMKYSGITPTMEEVEPEVYAQLRNAHDFDDSEKQVWDGEVF